MLDKDAALKVNWDESSVMLQGSSGLFWVFYHQTPHPGDLAAVDHFPVYVFTCTGKCKGYLEIMKDVIS